MNLAIKRTRTTIVWLIVLGYGTLAQSADEAASQSESNSLDGREIVSHCNYKDPGNDQRSTLTVAVRDPAGTVKKSVYQRLWKDYRGKDGLADKMILFTEFPDDAKGSAFMRWGYVPEAGKTADQWIYLPNLKTTRRVSARDAGDSFLGTDLTYGDIDVRGLDADTHTFLREETVAGVPYYVVQSIPKEKTSIYSKVISWFNKADDWADCAKRKVEYYDKRGDLLKTQVIQWQRVDGAWIWDKVIVKNAQTQRSSLFEVTDVEIDVGLQDSVFRERTLRLGQRQ